MQWLLHCLKYDGDNYVNSKLIELKPNANKSLGLEIEYSHGPFIKWTQLDSSSISHLRHNIDGLEKDIPIRIKPILPEQVLSEAFYF